MGHLYPKVAKNVKLFNLAKLPTVICICSWTTFGFEQNIGGPMMKAPQPKDAAEGAFCSKMSTGSENIYEVKRP